MEKLISLIIYLSCFAISLIISFLYQRYCKRRSYNKIPISEKILWFLLIIAAPVLISAIRYDVGTDYFAYVRIYENINHLDTSTVLRMYGEEPLYLLLNKLAFLIFKRPWGIFLLSSFLIHFFIIAGIDYFKEYVSIPMSLFVYYMFHFSFGLNGIRQMIAISIIFFALRYIYQKKLLHYMLLVAIAAMFHNTAILCLVFYFLVNNRMKELQLGKKIIYYCTIILTPIVLLFMIEIIRKIPFFSGYLHYVTNEIDYGLGFLLFIVPVIAPFFLFRKAMIIRNKDFEPFILISLLNIPFQYAGYYVNWGSRLVLYTNSIYYILVPYVISSLKNKHKKIVMILYYLYFFLSYYVLQFVLKNHHEVFPYKIMF